MKKSKFTSRGALTSLLPLILLAVVVIVWRHQLRQESCELGTEPSTVHEMATSRSSDKTGSFATAVGGDSDTAQTRHADPTRGMRPTRPPGLQFVARHEETVSSPVPPDFLKQILSADEKTASIPLPGGGMAKGAVTYIQRDDNGLLLVQGNVTEPEAGKFMFQRQTATGIAGSMVGHIHYDKSDVAYQIRPTGENGSPMLVKTTVDAVICRALPYFGNAADSPELAPETHPTNYPIPPSENGIIQLESLPDATAVVYLDFDGEESNFPSWGYINALPSGSSNTQIFDVWRAIAEDYQPFNINITTVRSVYDAAPQGRRMHVIFTPTNDAAPGAGGVAYVGSFNQTGNRVCWVFYSSGKPAVEAGSHEIGHTVGLYHDGRTSPSEGYYSGHNGWAPIMGVGYSQTLSQWSKGEYPSANNTEDDLNIIASNNNDVDYREDDYSSTYATSAWLDVASGGVVFNEGIIEIPGDQDAFRFSTSGGNLSLNINNASYNPNLDVKTEIVSSAGDVIATSDPTNSTDASFSALNLAAGDYFLRITGIGKGETDLATGYTNYGSLGSYIITGTINGGVTADHFTIAENAAVGSTVGTSAPRVSHGAGAPAHSISSGNVGETFTIDPASGAITVANRSALDFETLSSRWDDPASFELFVSITDSLGVATESVRTVVTVTDVNEPPVLAALPTQLLPENLALGTLVATAAATEPDRTDYVSYSIASGNTGNAFAINSVTGAITVAGVLDLETTPSYTLTVRASDHATPTNSVDTPLIVNLVNTAAGYLPGTIIRAIYNSISGATVASLTSNAKFPNAPDSLTTLTSFDGGASKGDNYGSMIRGYLIPPATGNYTFWIASDDASELRISPDSNPANAVVRASMATWSNQYDWTGNASQQSISIPLTAGQAYFIEVLHKEGGGGDHLAVAWQGPGMSVKEVIPGKWLAPLNANYAPSINVASYTIRENAVPGHALGTVTATDLNPTDAISGYTITAGNTGGVFAIHPVSGQLSLAQPGLLNANATPSYSLTIQATDNGTPPLSGTAVVTVNVISTSVVNVTGIVQEIWTGLSSSESISILTGNANYPHRPNVRRDLTSFDSGTYYADNYGSRIRVKFIPPSSGNYQFYISSDDESRLLFSADPSGAGATQIASISGYSNHNEWTKFTSQTSAVQTLVAGQAVYLETLHKEGGGGDHVSVGYTGPGTATTTVIPDSMLEPFNINAVPVFSPASYSYNVTAATATAGMILGTVIATEPNAETLAYGIVSGNASGAYAVHPGTGVITVTNPALLANGTANLQVVAQDGGLGGAYPLGVATATVVVSVTADNAPPVFTADPITPAAATQNLSYSSTLAGSAMDVDVADVLTFSKINGPGWLTVAADGTLGGTPLQADLGLNSFTVRVSDVEGLFDEATLEIVVRSNVKADNTNSLELGSSWVGGFALTSNDTATWIGAYNTAGSLAAVLPGSALTWKGIALGNLTGTAAGPVSIGGTGNATASSSLAIGSSGIDMTSANQNLVINSVNTMLGGSQTWNVASGRNLRFGSSGTGSANANIDGTGTITAAGGGLVDLNQGSGSGSGLAGFSGKWIVNTGTTLRGLRNFSDAFGTDSTADAITLSGGTLAVGGISGSQGNWSWNTNITLTASTTSSIDQQIFSGTGRSLKLMGTMSGSGNLTFKETGGTDSFNNDDLGFIVTGTNTMNGTVSIGGATENGIAGRLSSVRLGGINTSGITTTGAGTGGDFGTATVVNNGILTLSRSHAWTFANATSGSGKLRVSGGVLGATTQDVTVTGNNSYSGGTDIASGILRVSTYDTALGSNPLNFTGSATLATASSGGARTLANGITVGSTFTATLDSTFANLTLGGTISGAGNLATTGSGTTILGGNNSYSGATSAGGSSTLRVNGKQTGAGAVSIAATARLEGGGTLPGAVSLSGTIAPGDGVGTLSTGAVTLANASKIAWQAADWTGAAGTGYDKLVASSLNLTGVTTPVTVVLSAQSLTNFTDAPKTFTLVQTTGGITGFAANKFTIDQTALPSVPGTWAVQQIGNNLELAYTPANSAPSFSSPINGGNAPAAAPYTGSIASSGSDPNPGDTLTFSKTSGPAWLGIAPNGALSGTPGLGDVGPNNFTVRITDSAGLFAETTLTIPVTLTPTQTWQVAEFGSDASNPAIAGDDADPDGDGLKNLVEYALGTTPNTCNTSGIIHDIASLSGTHYLRLTVNKNPAATDLTFAVETCSDFSDWSSATTVVETHTENQLIARDTLAGARRFIRLKINR
jgi:autotransporter-associated beta strand protein